MEALKSDKTHLEHSLRQETLINEEQRNKMEILKKLVDHKKGPVDQFVNQAYI